MSSPPSGTRDFLAADCIKRDRVFGIVKSVFTRYGFEPLVTPAFERIDVLLGKYGEESDKLIFKILRRGEHEETGEADLALRYDMTVPLARVAASRPLPNPYKRYAIGPVWRADRPGKGRFREFTQCDIDILGVSSLLSDAEVILAINDVLVALGISGFEFKINSRNVISDILRYFSIEPEIADKILITLDKLDKMPVEKVEQELIKRALAPEKACELLSAIADPEGMRKLVDTSEVDNLITLLKGVPTTFSPSTIRGLNYYTGSIWEVTTPESSGSIASGGRYDRLIGSLGGPDIPAVGGSLGIERILMLLPENEEPVASLDVAVTVMNDGDPGSLTTLVSQAIAAAARAAGLRSSVYLGSSQKLRDQLKWANSQLPRWTAIYGQQESASETVTMKDMLDGTQVSVRLNEIEVWFRTYARKLEMGI